MNASSSVVRFALVVVVSAAAPVVGFHVMFATTRAAAASTPVPADDRCASACRAGGVAAAGWVAPVDAPLWQGFRPASNPGHDGVDLGAARGTPIRAAATGVVARVRCNITPTEYGCDRDGTPHTLGCGWYVDIHHTGNIYTRYCHMIRRPLVDVGQAVTVGQVIGYVGSSGHSSAPHLHFEIHRGDQTSATAINPVGFMKAHDAPLGAR